MWAQTLCDLLIFPLHDHGWSLERLSGELADRVRVPGEDETPRGVSKSTLQKVSKGDRLPSRDVVQQLLDVAAEYLPDPPGRAERERLWDHYVAALAKKNPDLHRFYLLMTARDEAVARAVRAETRDAQKAADLGRARRRMERLDSRLAYARVALRLQRELAGRQLQQVQDDAQVLQVRLRAQITDLVRENQGLQQEVDALRDDMDRAAAGSEERIAELVQDKTSVESELAALREQLAHDQARWEEEAAAGETARREHQAARVEIDVLNDRVRDLEEKYAAAARQVDELQGQLEATGNDLSQARRALLRSEGQLAQFMEELEAARVQRENEQDALSQAGDALASAWQAIHDEYDRRPELPALVPTPETTSSASSPPLGVESHPTAGAVAHGGGLPAASSGPVFQIYLPTPSEMRAAWARAAHRTRKIARRIPPWLMVFFGLLSSLGLVGAIVGVIVWCLPGWGPLTFQGGDRPQVLSNGGTDDGLRLSVFAWNLSPSQRRQVTATFTAPNAYAGYDDFDAIVEQTSANTCPGGTVQWDVRSSGSPVASGFLTRQEHKYSLKKHASAFPGTVTLTLRRTDTKPCTVAVHWTEPSFYKPEAKWLF
ncbi:hypothetical protein ACFZA1_37875 [Streptomyces filipinensis]|uniref:hypothetical protein n=1 Tax=Streptomyces filipinensis TaxID=66887 RepID=UPI0036EB6C51